VEVRVDARHSDEIHRSRVDARLFFYTHRYAERVERGGTRAPRVAAALPALPEATLLTPLCGALAATRQYETGGEAGFIART
jgi:hypothetical protein